MTSVTAAAVVDRLFVEVWGDPKAGLPDDLIHDDYWSTDPGPHNPMQLDDGGNLVPTFVGRDAFARELAYYRDFYADFRLTMLETVTGPSTMNDSVRLFEAGRFQGDVVVVGWTATATHPTATIVNRAGKPIPATVSDRGVSIVRVVDGRVFAADKFWNADSEVLSGMGA